jgi:hypothetical protein
MSANIRKICWPLQAVPIQQSTVETTLEHGGTNQVYFLSNRTSSIFRCSKFAKEIKIGIRLLQAVLSQRSTVGTTPHGETDKLHVEPTVCAKIKAKWPTSLRKLEVVLSRKSNIETATQHTRTGKK